MADFSAQLRLAQQLISQNGREVTFRKLQASGVSPSAPWKTESRPTAQSVVRHAIFVSPGGGADFGFTEEADQSAEQMAIVAGGSVDLGTFHQISDPITGGEWTIVKTQVLRPAEQVLLYGFEVKR